MLIAIIGPRGSGKTLLVVRLGCHSKRLVYANFKINAPHYRPLEITDLLSLKNNVDVIIDEGYAWIESRTSGKALNRYISYIILQSRKRNIDIYITAQMFSSLDIRFRYQCDVIVKCKRIPDGFKYSFLDVATGKILNYIFPEINAEKYYNRFDTYEIIEPSALKLEELKILKQNNPAKYNEKMEDIAEEIRPLISGKITHPKVRAKLIVKKYPIDKDIESFVYLHLKGLIAP